MPRSTTTQRRRSGSTAPCASSPTRPTARCCWGSSPPGWRDLRSTQWPTPAIARFDLSMPDLLIGPLLRYVSETEATIWVETSEQCEVEILGRREPTSRVEDHHYALVRLEGLDPDSAYEYQVALDGRQVWPVLEGLPPRVIHTLGGQGPLEI